jgi:hypothetical protein
MPREYVLNSGRDDAIVRALGLGDKKIYGLTIEINAGAPAYVAYLERIGFAPNEDPNREEGDPVIAIVEEHEYTVNLDPLLSLEFVQGLGFEYGERITGVTIHYPPVGLATTTIRKIADNRLETAMDWSRLHVSQKEAL